MKKVKHYINIELAKKKVARYSYWSIKDENGITICSSEGNNPDGKNFEELLDKITKDNVDAEVQIKYGTNELSARSNPPLFIRINEAIEWIDPEPDDTVSINGVPHKLDRNGNVNINLTTPEHKEAPKVEFVQMDNFRQEMDMQLSGMRKEYELKEQKWQDDMHNKLTEQNLKFKEMMLAERENRINEKEQNLNFREHEVNQKEEDVRDKVKTVLKQTTPALGSLVMGMLSAFKPNTSPDLGEVKKEVVKEKPKRTKVAFNIQEDEPELAGLEDELIEEEEPINEAIEETIDYPLEEEYLIEEATDEDLEEVEKE